MMTAPISDAINRTRRMYRKCYAKEFGAPNLKAVSLGDGRPIVGKENLTANSKYRSFQIKAGTFKCINKSCGPAGALDVAKVLVVDDDEMFLDALNKNLTADGFEVITAPNGKVALESLKSDKFDLVVSDINMPEMNGVDLIKAIRSTSQIPVILITGFSQIMETQAAYNLGANEFIPKPFKREELLAAVNRCLDAAGDAGNHDAQYCKLGIVDFAAGRKINFNIFVRLTSDKYVKIAHKGEDISVDRIRFYQDKGLKYLYLRREDFRKYIGFSLRGVYGSVILKDAELQRKATLLKHAGKILHDRIRLEGVNELIFESALAFVEATLDLITDDVNAVKILESLRGHSDYIFPHSLGVCMYSVMIAQSVDWNLPTNKYKVALGGLFHDIGMQDLRNDLLLSEKSKWTPDDVNMYQSHPLLSGDALNRMEGIPEDVREIVKQHHENSSAHGYPFGLKKASIHPMAKLISVADEFCYRVVESPLFDQMDPLDALQDMTLKCGAQLDRKFFDGLARVFGLKTARPNSVL